MTLAACGEERKNTGVIKKDSGVADPADSGVVNNPPDSGVVNNPPDSGVNNPPDSGMNNPPPDSGMNTPPDSGMMNQPFDGGMLVGDPFDPNARAAEYAQTLCAFRTRCEPALYEFLGSDETACRNETTAQLLKFWPSFQQAIAAGRAAFSQAGFAACRNAYDSADCIVGVAPDACDDIFTSNRPAGAACGSQIECSPGNWCALQALGGCGTCTDRAGVGDDCSQTLCETTMDCFDVQGAPTCAPINAQQNGTCGTIQTGLCQGRLQCVGTQAGTCVRPAGPGQACVTDGTAADCDIYFSQGCDPGNPMGTCGTVTFNGPGTMCGGLAGCNSQGGCDQMTMQCVAWPAAGLACPDGACADGAYCDAQGTCQTIKNMGANCMSSVECGDNYCVNGACGPITYQVCN
jgi:hypothetical protein